MRVIKLALLLSLVGCGSDSDESSGSGAATSYPLSNTAWDYIISPPCRLMYIFEATTFREVRFCVDIDTVPETVYVEETEGTFSDTGSQLTLDPTKSTCPNYSGATVSYELKNGGEIIKVDLDSGSLALNKRDDSSEGDDGSDTETRYVYGCYDSQGNFTPES